MLLSKNDIQAFDCKQTSQTTHDSISSERSLILKKTAMLVLRTPNEQNSFQPLFVH
jgi:hypothetical protein